jgi:uncharacterized protein HemX
LRNNLSKEDIAMVQNSKKQDSQSQKKVVRIMTLISMVLFLGHTGYYFGKTLLGRPQQAEPPETTKADINTQLQTQERGYQIVLEREPENQTALEGLLNVRLEMNDKQGAIKPLEKLIILNPEKEDYKNLLKQLEQDL